MQRYRRKAHPVDIARHLADNPHPAVSVHSITEGVGMGSAQIKLQDAMHAAVDAGYVAVADVDGKSMATLTDLGRKMASVDPEVHSIHLDAHTPLTIQPADVQVSCRSCYLPYKDGDWQLLLVEARDSSNWPFTLCKQCVTAVAAGAAAFPTAPAPWVEY